MRAIEQAYQTLIPRGRHPAALLFVDMRPEEVDVNVHPMKTEVRFRNSGAVFEVVYHALRDRLSDQTDESRRSPIDRRRRDRALHHDVVGAEPTMRCRDPASRRAACGWCPMRPRESAFQRPLTLAFDRDRARQCSADPSAGPDVLDSCASSGKFSPAISRSKTEEGCC